MTGDQRPSYYDKQRLNGLRKRAPSRETIVQIQRLALYVDGDDANVLADAAEFLLEVRQTLRGGRRNVSGGKHWPTDT